MKSDVAMLGFPSYTGTHTWVKKNTCVHNFKSHPKKTSGMQAYVQLHFYSSSGE